MKQIKLRATEFTLTATISDNATSRDLLSLLPLSLTLEDYNRIEKISDLPKRLSVSNAPEGYKPSAGDIAYYAPWGNLAIFYKDYSYSKGLILIGKIIDAGQALNAGGPMAVIIEAV